MVDKFVPRDPEEADLARLLLGGYEGLDKKKPVTVEILVYKDGLRNELYYGMVNPCKFGDQCEGHACYCDHPKGPRKCGHSWYYGEATNLVVFGKEFCRKKKLDPNEKVTDETCEYFEPNPYWQKDIVGDFYDKRYATVEKMKELGLVNESEEYIETEAPLWMKG